MLIMSDLRPNVDIDIVKGRIYEAPNPMDQVFVGLVSQRKILGAEKTKNVLDRELRPVKLELSFEIKKTLARMLLEIIDGRLGNTLVN